ESPFDPSAGETNPYGQIGEPVPPSEGPPMAPSAGDTIPNRPTQIGNPPPPGDGPTAPGAGDTIPGHPVYDGYPEVRPPGEPVDPYEEAPTSEYPAQDPVDPHGDTAEHHTGEPPPPTEEIPAQEPVDPYADTQELPAAGDTLPGYPPPPP